MHALLLQLESGAGWPNAKPMIWGCGAFISHEDNLPSKLNELSLLAQLTEFK
jgi:hypothetical protein